MGSSGFLDLVPALATIHSPPLLKIQEQRLHATALVGVVPPDCKGS